MHTSNTPLLRQATPLALFWFLIMGALGVFFPYYGLYLRENIGLQGVQIGAIFATLPLVGFFRSAVCGALLLIALVCVFACLPFWQVERRRAISYSVTYTLFFQCSLPLHSLPVSRARLFL